ncbi:MAG: PH domain-containing protein [Elusimicrobia bacterium]|nr:PH domain-containing protein [Elusimicrobiota bacterium]
MSYIDASLMDGETVVYRTRPHAITCLRPAAQTAVGIVAACLLFFFSAFWAGLAVAAIAAAASFPAFARFFGSEYGVTNKRIFVQTGGLMERRTLETAVSRVAVISVEQDLWGKILGYGSVVLNGAGGIKDTLPQMRAPFEFRRKVFEQVLREAPAEPKLELQPAAA